MLHPVKAMNLVVLLDFSKIYVMVYTNHIVNECIITIFNKKGGFKMSKEDFFPDIITNLQEANIPVEGVRAYLLQGMNQQLLFMTFDNDVEVPEHTHEAQWGVVLDGEIELTIGGTKCIINKGDTYFIPKGVKHSAKIKKGYKDITLFNQKDRYKVK